MALFHEESFTKAEAEKYITISSVCINSPKCIYCMNDMITRDIDDLWYPEPVEFVKDHSDVWPSLEVPNDLGVTPEELELSGKEPIVAECKVYVCKICGWWVFEKEIYASSKFPTLWNMFYRTAGKLRNLDLANIKVPIEEVRNYLAAKHEARFTLHPKKFEETVASVFRDLGYKSRVTAYSNDGGIDVILSDSSDRKIGVQVKRFKDKIKVEQIRSFLGALIVNNFAKGFYITTSDFQKGAYKLAEQCSREFVPIQLLNADKFFQALEIAQIKKFDGYMNYPFDILANIPEMFLIDDFPLNSL